MARVGVNRKLFKYEACALEEDCDKVIEAEWIKGSRRVEPVSMVQNLLEK